ncbi:MAG: peroxiredoxin [Negativicutes bacterium]|nr:peroxiredoxin [Negativicutes bacterium]
MDEVSSGQPAPDFTLPATGGKPVSLSSYRGQRIVLFFYSKDNTSGCTAEVHEFGDLYNEIAAAGALVFGVSRDSLATHEKFSAKLQLPYPLLSDANGLVCRLYGVLKEKNMYGKKVLGVERSTFIIDAEGRIEQAFRKVKAAGHAGAVLAALQPA